MVKTGELGIIGETRMEREKDRQIAEVTQSGPIKHFFRNLSKLKEEVSCARVVPFPSLERWTKKKENVKKNLLTEYFLERFLVILIGVYMTNTEQEATVFFIHVV